MKVDIRKRKTVTMKMVRKETHGLTFDVTIRIHVSEIECYTFYCLCPGDSIAFSP